MATRFYMPSSGTAPASPTPSASWGSTAGTSRMPTSTAKSNTAFDSSGTYTETSTTNNINVLGRQFVSEPLAAQTITGTFSLVIACLESSTNANASLQAIVRVVSNDGSTVRGTLYAGHSAANNSTAGALGQEMATTGQTRIMSAVSLTSVTVQDGDRLVVEVGGRFANTTATAMSQTFQWGDPSSASDYALTAGNTSLTPAAWFEFSQNLTFQSAPVGGSFPTLVASYPVSVTASNLNALATSSFTPAAGEVIVVKAAAANSVLTWNNLPSATGLTFTRNGYDATAQWCSAGVWTATVGASPSAMTVSLTPTGSGSPHSMVVERWSNAKLAATPAVNTTDTGASGTAPSTTLTTAAANSVVSWVCADWSATAPGTPAYRSGATQETVVDLSPSEYVAYYAYQQAASAGSQTLGMTAPTQKWALLGVEVQYAGPLSARYDAHEPHQSTVSLGAQSSYTVSFWGKLFADRNNYSTFVALDSGSSSSLHIQTTVDGASFHIWDDVTSVDANGSTFPVLTVGTWYFFAVAVSGSTGTLYYRAYADASLTSVALSGMSSTRTIGRVDIGSNYVSEFLNGNVAAVKLWAGAQLSSTELLAESNYYDAVRTSSLSRAWRLNGTAAEQTGNGSALTGGSTAAWEAGPDIPLTSTATFTPRGAFFPFMYG